MQRIDWLAGALAAALVAMGLSGVPGAGAALAQPAPPPPPAVTLADLPLRVETGTGPVRLELVAAGLNRPWGIAFLPDGAMLVTERVGRLRLIHADGRLDPQPIEGLPAIYTRGIAGLKGIALDPDFANNRLIYMAYSKPHPSAQDVSTLAVMRARWDGGHQLADVTDIFVAEPWYGGATLPQRCCGQGPAFGSYGGRLLFDADGYLFVTSGDRNYGEMVDRTDNDLGKILRLDRDGHPAPNNPWAALGGRAAAFWSTGHRNPLGLAIHPVSGDLWESEFGPRGGDELNRIVRGGHYGWMQVTQGQHYNNEPVGAVSHVPGRLDPVRAYAAPFNPGNLAFYFGGRLPGWEGNLLLGSFSQGLLRYQTDQFGNPVGEPEHLLQDMRQRWRDVAVGPDGAVYLLTDQVDGAVLRIVPED